jgi:hypothetical protein
MNVELVTKDDLKELENNLLNAIKLINKPGQGEVKKWLKSVEVRKLLNISPRYFTKPADQGHIALY